MVDLYSATFNLSNFNDWKTSLHKILHNVPDKYLFCSQTVWAEHDLNNLEEAAEYPSPDLLKFHRLHLSKLIL